MLRQWIDLQTRAVGISPIDLYMGGHNIVRTLGHEYSKYEIWIMYMGITLIMHDPSSIVAGTQGCIFWNMSSLDLSWRPARKWPWAEIFAGLHHSWARASCLQSAKGISADVEWLRYRMRYGFWLYALIFMYIVNNFEMQWNVDIASHRSNNDFLLSFIPGILQNSLRIVPLNSAGRN